MNLDPDLKTLSDRIDKLSGLGDKAQFSPEQQAQLNDALKRSQHERYDGAPPVGRWRQELEFFLVCLGYVLLAFAVLVLMRWSVEAPGGAAGAFGLAFLTGVSGALFGAYYARPASTHARGAVLLASGFVFVVSLFALIAAQAIGGVLGLVVGVVFFRALALRRQQTGAPLAGQTSG